MKTFKGISASPGIVIGKVFLYVDDAGQIPKYTISADQVDAELERFFRGCGEGC